MKLVLASDHAGFQLRETLADYARTLGHDVITVGAPTEEAYDYPDAADEGVEKFMKEHADFAVFVCGSGIGICMRANKHHGIRAADCTSVEMAKLARQHNHANVLCLGQRITEPDMAKEIMEAFLNEAPDTTERHQRRVDKINGNVTAPRQLS